MITSLYKLLLFSTNRLIKANKRILEKTFIGLHHFNSFHINPSPRVANTIAAKFPAEVSKK